MGAGQTAIAAMRTGRHYVGMELDPDYVALAERRVEEALHLFRTPEPG
jgi:DNA modification methylase